MAALRRQLEDLGLQMSFFCPGGHVSVFLVVSAGDVVGSCLVVLGDVHIPKKRGTWQEAQQSRDSFENDYLKLLQKYDQTGEDRLLMAKLRQVFEEAGQSRLLEEFETASTTDGLDEDPDEEEVGEGDEEGPEDEPDEGGEEPDEGDEGDEGEEGDEPDEGDGDEEEEEEAGEDDQLDDKARGKVASEDTDGKVKAAPKGWTLSLGPFVSRRPSRQFIGVHPNSIGV